MGKVAQAEPSTAALGPRLFVSDALDHGVKVTVGAEQSHYLSRVMRLGAGSPIRVFNGRDGEWLAAIVEIGKRGALLQITECLRPQPPALPDLRLCIAPIRRNRLEMIVEKGVELGVTAFLPVITQHTVARLPNGDRLERLMIEAAEQCERLDLPRFLEPVVWADYLARQAAQSVSVIAAVERSREPLSTISSIDGPVDVLIGPEGGFAAGEVEALERTQNVRVVSLGAGILRSETAAMAALSWIRLNGLG